MRVSLSSNMTWVKPTVITRADMVILKARRFLGYRGGDRFDRRRRLHDRSKTGYCYEMTPERNDLTVVEQRIRAAKEYIYKQERLIERLAAEAKNTDDAFALLNILNRALRLFERHQLLLDRLGLSETEKDD